MRSRISIALLFLALSLVMILVRMASVQIVNYTGIVGGLICLALLFGIAKLLSPYLDL